MSLCSIAGLALLGLASRTLHRRQGNTDMEVGRPLYGGYGLEPGVEADRVKSGYVGCFRQANRMPRPAYLSPP